MAGVIAFPVMPVSASEPHVAACCYPWIPNLIDRYGDGFTATHKVDYFAIRFRTQNGRNEIVEFHRVKFTTWGPTKVAGFAVVPSGSDPCRHKQRFVFTDPSDGDHATFGQFRAAGMRLSAEGFYQKWRGSYHPRQICKR